MKKTLYHLLCAGLLVAFSSCELIEKATEQDVALGDFSFTISTSLADVSRADGDTGFHYAGSYTISTAELLGNAAVTASLIRSVSFGSVTLGVRQSIDDVMVESLTLSCDGIASFVESNVALTQVGASQSQTQALVAFANALLNKVIRSGEATPALDVALSREIQVSTIDWEVKLNDVVVRAGLDL